MMQADNLMAFYQTRVERFQHQFQHIQKQISTISKLRLAMVAFIFISIYFIKQVFFLYAILVLLLIGFLLLLYIHQKKKREAERLNVLIKINEAEAKHKQDVFSDVFTNCDIPLLPHPYRDDLDIIGKHSLFHYINRSGTISGANRVASLLLFGLEDESKLIPQQQFYKAWESDVEARQAFQTEALLSNEKKDDRAAIERWINQTEIFKHRSVLSFLRFVLPLLTIASIVGTALGILPLGIVLLFILINWSITGFYFKSVSLFHQEISEKGKLLFRYASLLSIIQRKQFEDKKGKALQEQCKAASIQLKKLSTLLEWFDARLNLAASFFLNTLFLYDIQFVYAIEKWKQKYKHNLPNWLSAATETEAAITFATLSFNHPQFVTPTVSDNVTFQLQEVAHPLLANQHVVANSLSFIQSQALALVTGANMAGKSTFLRAIGVNFILAKSGANVFAKAFHFPWITLRTGMRTNDSLHDHQSYFYAELYRLKDIIETLQQGIPQLILLDEILKGTNSNDKLFGSQALIKQLINLPALSLIATHDVALGEMQTHYPNKIQNVHFEPSIVGDELHFDYRLKPGIAEKMNATFLMKKMGIIPSEG
ncbi:MAG: MutS-related protein [Chryseotalea sp.]